MFGTKKGGTSTLANLFGGNNKTPSAASGNNKKGPAASSAGSPRSSFGGASSGFGGGSGNSFHAGGASPRASGGGYTAPASASSPREGLGSAIEECDMSALYARSQDLLSKVHARRELGTQTPTDEGRQFGRINEVKRILEAMRAMLPSMADPAEQGAHFDFLKKNFTRISRV